MMRTAARSREFLGRGLDFPFAVDPNGRLAAAGLERRIETSIQTILGTAPGERLMRPDFGCGIHELPFSPNDGSTISRVAEEVSVALRRFEPRIDLLDVTAAVPEGQQNLILIRIDFVIRQNNAITNLVYPFFITEGF